MEKKMEKQFDTPPKYISILLGILVFLGIYLTSHYNYLLFHSLAEIFSIVVACGIFVIVWNSRKLLDNNYLLFIGIAYLFVGGLDLIHTLAYKGMGIFQGYETNLATQIWIATRYVQSLSLFIAPFFFGRKLKVNSVFLGYALATFLLLMSIFYWNIFPVCFVEGVGLTPFKKISEYIISLILLASIVLLLKNRKEFDANVLKWIVCSLILTIISELSFTFYIDAYGLSNLIGHIFKILSFYFIYKAIIETGLLKPYILLFRDLKQSEERFRNIFEQSPIGIELYDSGGQLVEINKACLEIFGILDLAEVRGFKLFEDPNLSDEIKDKLKRGETVKYEAPFDFEKVREHKLYDTTESGTIDLDVLITPLGLKQTEAPMGYLVQVQDITERKKAEEKIRESEYKYRELYEGSQDGFVRTDMEGNIKEFNQAYKGMLGYSKEELLRLTYIDLTPTKWHSMEVNIIKEQVLPKGYSMVYEKEYIKKDGTIFPISLRTYLIKDTNGHPSGMWAFVRDITKRKEMEEALRRSRDELEMRVQERTTELVKLNEALQAEIAERKRAEKILIEQSRILEAFFTSTITPLVFLDRDFNFVRVNKAYAKACQRDISEFPGHNHFEFYPSDAKPIFEEVAETKVPYQAIARPFTFPDHPEWGITYWDWTLTPILDNAGEVEFLVFSLNDVTERKRAEEELRDISLYARSLIEASLDPLVTISANGKIMDVNSATELVTGLSRDRLIGSDFSDYFTEPEKAREGYKKVFLEGSVLDYPLAIRHTSGKVTDVLYNATVYRSEAGEVQGIFAAARDITEQKEAENRIQSTNALLSLFSKKSVRKEYLDSVVDLIQSWSGCRCVGIRVLDKHELIPYESYAGFSQEFWESENALSIKRDQCACIRVITGNPDPQDVSMMTPGGSFHCDNTFKFVGQLSEEEKARFRGVCIQNGFLSVSIVPIRYQEEVLGAIHLADEREGQVPLKAMEFIESVAPLIGEAFNRFNLEEEIRESESRLRSLSSQLLTVQENERRRVAREIHDGLGQMLTATKFKMENIIQQKGKGEVKTKGKSLETLIPLMQESIEEVRRIQMDLRPSTLDDLGILATIGWFCREFEKIYSTIHIETQLKLQEHEVSDSLKTVIYRVMQEALNNIAKYSKADLVHLSLKKEENKIELEIDDNGIGFDIEDAKKGFGLGSMRERTELSGGSFEIESVIGKGTVIKAIWPT
jgi:PAS domain S-box-containing protein